MLINNQEIYDSAWLDSQYFDKEGFLIVKDHIEQVNYTERFVRLRGNLLYILAISSDQITNTDCDSQLAKKSLSNKTEDTRIQSLINYHKENLKSNVDLLFVIVLSGDFNLCRSDEAKNCGFIIEFPNISTGDHQINRWSFICMTIEERDGWIQSINRANLLNLKSIFNLLLQRKQKLIKKHLINSTNGHSINKSNSSNDLIRSSSPSVNESISSTDSTTVSQLARSVSVASSLSVLSTTSIDTKESALISQSSTTTSQIAQNKLIDHQEGHESRSVFLTDSYFDYKNSSPKKLIASFSFTLTANFTKLSITSPNIFVKVYCSLTSDQWSVIGRTETLNTHLNQTLKFTKKFYLNLYEKIESQNNRLEIVELDSKNPRILLKFNVYNLIEPFTNRFILVGTAIDYFKPDSSVDIFSSIRLRQFKIGTIMMSTLDNNEYNIFNHQNDDKNMKNRTDEHSQIITPDNRKHLPTMIESEKTKVFSEFGSLIEPQLFTNIIHRSFQFELNPVTIININELMGEPVLIFSLVNDLMSIFMDDEKRLMNNITYSLGEVRQEYQRKQMQMLETHLRLVNCLTESINSLNQVQTGTKFFRQSVQKKETFFQFVPLNLHLQRSIFNKKTKRPSIAKLNSNSLESFDVLNVYTHGCFTAHRLGFENGGLSSILKEIDNSAKEINYFHLKQIWSTMKNYFKIISLSKQITELTDKMIELLIKMGNQTDLKLTKKTELSDDLQRLKIDIQSEATQQFLRDKMYLQKVILKLFSRIEDCCLQITDILDLKQVDSTLTYLDIFRAQQSFDCSSLEEENVIDEQPKLSLDENQITNRPSMLSTVKSSINSTMKFNLINSAKSNNSKSMTTNFEHSVHKQSNVVSKMERTISCPLDQVQSSNEMMQKTENKLRKLRRHNSDNRIDDHLEFEPVDLVHLNIKAMIILMQSKLNHLISFNLESYRQQNFNYSSVFNKIVDELKPSTKKLYNSIDSLVKTSSICYALESLKLSKDQSEYFYLIRSRRNMCFAQVIVTFTIALMSELTCPKVNRNEYLDDLYNMNSFNDKDLGNLNDLTNFNDDSTFLNRLFEQRHIVCFFESMLSCYGEEIGMLEDMDTAINELNRVQVVFTNLYHDNTADRFKKSFNNLLSNNKLLNNGIINTPKFQGNGYNLQIKIPFYDETLPDEFTCQIVGLLFNIGINESATLAETIGHVKIQEDINQKSFLKLENFINSHANIRSKQLIDNLTGLKTELYSYRAKNVRILQLSEQIAYDLNAIRFTNCKSGKDRTAMSCTLEQVRKCGQKFDFNEINKSKLFQQMLDTLRSEGTRRENTRKNVGRNMYAFNSLRTLTLPKFYRPPAGSYSRYIQT